MNWQRIRVIVAGGDGTAGWLLEVVCDLRLTFPQPIATVPLGTGNNLPFYIWMGIFNYRIHRSDQQVETYWGNVNPIGVQSCCDKGKGVAETLTMDYHRGLNVEVEGILGQTYHPEFENPAKPGVAMPVVGGEDKYKLSSVLFRIVESVSFLPLNMHLGHFYQPYPNLNLLGQAWRLYKEEKFFDMVDDVILESCNHSDVYRAILIELLCVQPYPEDRPSMAMVSLMLSSKCEIPEPNQLGFYTERKLLDSDLSSSLISEHSCEF